MSRRAVKEALKADLANLLPEVKDEESENESSDDEVAVVPVNPFSLVCRH